MTNDPGRFLVAHRGDQEAAVENTLPAFVNAVRGGARFIECDVQFTRDGIPLIMHDNNLRRLLGVNDIRISTHTLAQIVNWLPHWSPFHLQDMLDWLGRQAGLTLFLELKPPALRYRTAGKLVRMLKEILPVASQERLVIISQSAALLEVCAELLPFRLGWVAIGKRRPLCRLAYVFLDKRRLASMHEWQTLGVQVAVYTVNETKEALSLKMLGVNLVETNYFTRLRRQLGHGGG